jgi:hypothetical protein
VAYTYEYAGDTGYMALAITGGNVLGLSVTLFESVLL